MNIIKEIPLHRRTNILSLSCAMNMANRHVKEGAIRAHTNSIKPSLTEEQKKACLQHCLSSLDQGKLGIFPFVFKQPAKRRSKNGDAGTLGIKPILAVTKVTTRAWLIEKVLPPIRAKWPAQMPNALIFIQQDNAKPYIGVSDVEFVEAARQGGFDIRLCFQSSNSPDLNVLDLGIFRAIQSLQHQTAPSNVDELVEIVETSFIEMKAERLNHVFLTLQSCMIENMKDGGGNNYKVPHMEKERLEREGNLPLQLLCDINIVNQALASLQQ